VPSFTQQQNIKGSGEGLKIEFDAMKWHILLHFGAL